MSRAESLMLCVSSSRGEFPQLGHCVRMLPWEEALSQLTGFAPVLSNTQLQPSGMGVHVSTPGWPSGRSLESLTMNSPVHHASCHDSPHPQPAATASAQGDGTEQMSCSWLVQNHLAHYNLIAVLMHTSTPMCIHLQGPTTPHWACAVDFFFLLYLLKAKWESFTPISNKVMRVTQAPPKHWETN